MSNKNQKKVTQQKKNNNIMTYAIIMIISVIIIILIAAMADDREEQIDNRIMETQRTNESIQNELVSLKDENYKLNKSLEEKDDLLNAYNAQNEALNNLNNVWNIYQSGDKNAAITALSTIDKTQLDENLSIYYDVLSELIK